MKRIVLVIAVAAGLSGPAHAATENAVGVNTHIPATDVVELVADLGAKWSRVDNNWLQHTDPCSDDIGWLPALDQTVLDAQAMGVSVYMTLAYTPPCASVFDTDGEPNNDVPLTSLWENYVRQAVAHYRAMGVTHYGMWNEPNIHFWEGTAQEYVDVIVVPGMDAVELGCSDAGFTDCMVLGPDLAHIGDYDVFLEDVIDRMDAQGAQFDIFTHHIYQGHDTPVYAGDAFLNALIDRRFPFTRRSLLNVLADTGHMNGDEPEWEIWITETGYHAQPPIDTGEMDYQEKHVMWTIDEQLQRDWWNNTFFYEILDSGDDLDGFGITRRNTDGSFFLKPAYLSLADRIANEPQLNGTLTQCNDGEDNDGDDLVDLDDPGCVDAADDDESDDPGPTPTPTVEPTPEPTPPTGGDPSDPSGEVGCTCAVSPSVSARPFWLLALCAFAWVLERRRR